MLKLGLILCKIGIHQWSTWTSFDTPIEAVTGHDGLDAISDELYVETKTRSCECCGRGDMKQVLRW